MKIVPMEAKAARSSPPVALLKAAICAFLLVSFFTTNLLAQTGHHTGPDAVARVWESADKTGIMQVYKSGSTYSGKMLYGVRLFEADGKTFRKDVHNHDPKLRGRSLENYPYLTGLTYQNGRWENGKLYDFDSGNGYDVDLEIEDNVLLMRAYKGARVFGRTFKWNRK